MWKKNALEAYVEKLDDNEAYIEARGHGGGLDPAKRDQGRRLRRRCLLCW